MGTDVVARRGTYAGLFMVTLATLMYEVLLTRIFSVTMWYHFAFVAISVAMFGMTAGAIVVYLFPGYFTVKRAKRQLALCSLLFAVSVVLSFLTYLSIPFVAQASLTGLYSIALTYAVLAVPFVFSGICVCLALTRFPQQLNRLYAADLVGAAVGCILLIYMLNVTDGPTAVIVVSFLATIGTLLFAVEAGFGKLGRTALICAVVLGAFAGLNTVLAGQQASLLRLMWVKGELEPQPLFEKWNSFSRIKIRDDLKDLDKPFGWGMSPTFPTDRKVSQLFLDIDASASTILTGFDGDLGKAEHLKYDVTNVAHYAWRDAKVMVVGTGGGRDILSALVFDQKSVVGVEINDDIIKATNNTFGDFTGHLDQNPKVTLVNDEARSYISRSKDQFDIIQISLIDTWAATAGGAFVLTENSLYTVEAWQTFLSHLSPTGVLSVSRWYFRDNPGEMYRLTALATASLKQIGVENPRQHIVILRLMFAGDDSNIPDGIGTMLVSNQPFSDKDLDTLQEIAGKMKFGVVLSPRYSLDSTFATIASGDDLAGFTARFPLNIAPPTDDSPFFFHLLRLSDVFNRDLWSQGVMSFNVKAVFVLGALLIVVVVLTFACIVVPLMLTTKRVAWSGTFPFFAFFSSIGLGFMFVEISQVQRLIVFLGHPTYSLSVVLFTLLLSSGLGSYSVDRVGNPSLRGSALARLLLLIGALAVFGTLTPLAITAFQSAETAVRILVAVAIIFPLGLFMGMAFPLGMKVASARSADITPWLWGINGATSVCASVLAVAIALSASISTSYWTGFAAYVAAVVVFVWATRGRSKLV